MSKAAKLLQEWMKELEDQEQRIKIVYADAPKAVEAVTEYNLNKIREIQEAIDELERSNTMEETWEEQQTVHNSEENKRFDAFRKKRCPECDGRIRNTGSRDNGWIEEWTCECCEGRFEYTPTDMGQTLQVLKKVI